MLSKRVSFISRYGFIFLLILSLSACSLPFGNSADVELAVNQTLSALNTQSAAAAVVGTPTAAPETATPMTPPENTPVPIMHVIMPGEMQAIESTIDDVLYNGDNFTSNLYERPFTPIEMQNRFDLDLQKISMSTDNTFFYFSLDLLDVNIGTKTLDGDYGIEFDLDRDGRGDYLLYSFVQPISSTWDSSGVALFTDVNINVGSTRPLLSDPVTQTDGYETELWPSKPITDPDGAWLRLAPGSATTVQLAVKRSLLGNPVSYLWGAWADGEIKAPYRFDYNDAFTEVEAGSPYATSVNYPLKKVSQLDNTCREAWGFKPIGNEPGLCKKAVTVQPTTKPIATTTKAPTKQGSTPVVITPGITLPPPPVCTDVQITGQVTPWDVAYTDGVTLCINGDCRNPDSLGYVAWYLPPGTYEITGSSPYGISPSSSGNITLNCGEKSLIQFTIGPG